MRASGEELEGQRRERGQDCLGEGLPASPVLRGGAVHAVQQAVSLPREVLGRLILLE